MSGVNGNSANGNGKKQPNPRRCERVGCRKVPPKESRLCQTHLAELAAMVDPTAFPWKEHAAHGTPRDPETGVFTEKLSPEIVDLLCQRLEVGVPCKHAAQSAGISEDTFWKWLRRSRDDDAPIEYRVFAERVDRALANFVVTQVATVNKHGTSEWQAAMTLLERRLPEEFGRRQRVDHANADGEPFKLAGVDLELEGLTPDELAILKLAAQRQLEKERAAGNVIDLTQRRALGAGG